MRKFWILILKCKLYIRSYPMHHITRTERLGTLFFLKFGCEIILVRQVPSIPTLYSPWCISPPGWVSSLSSRQYPNTIARNEAKKGRKFALSLHSGWGIFGIAELEFRMWITKVFLFKRIQYICDAILIGTCAIRGNFPYSDIYSLFRLFIYFCCSK